MSDAAAAALSAHPAHSTAAATHNDMDHKAPASRHGRLTARQRACRVSAQKSARRAVVGNHADGRVSLTSTAWCPASARWAS